MFFYFYYFYKFSPFKNIYLSYLNEWQDDDNMDDNFFYLKPNLSFLVYHARWTLGYKFFYSRARWTLFAWFLLWMCNPFFFEG
jgi:hypothetical protein